MRVFRHLSLALALCVASVTPSAATTFIFKATLTPEQEVGQVVSPATGKLKLIYDDITHSLSLKLSFSGLTDTTSAAHIHFGAPGVNGPVMTPGQLPGFPVGVTSGAVSIVLDLTSSTAFLPSFLTQSGGTIDLARESLLARMDAGLTYFNVHTVAYPAGEIRGQILKQPAAVPLPAALPLLLMALSGLALVRRRA